MKEFFTSKIVFGVLIGLGACVLLLGSFALGVTIGQRKAAHLCAWGQNYDQMFGPQRHGPPLARFPFNSAETPESQGVFGKVLSVSGSDIVVQGKDNVEQNVLVTTSTVIRNGAGQGSLQGIHPDVQASVFGPSNAQGQIEARLIRIFPTQ